MLQERKKPTFGQTFSQGISEGLEKFQELKKQQKEMAALKKTGIDEDLPTEFQKMSHQANLKKKEEAQKLQGNLETENRDYQTVSDRWGKPAADLWRASDPGAKTEIVKNLFEKENREKQRSIPGNEGFITELDEDDKGNKSEPLKDYDFGLTAKERTSRQNARYSTNLPLYEESHKKLDAADSEQYHLDILEELSPQITNLDKMNINPMSGELIIPALASPAAQRFVKTINDFTVNAKDSYGARVTNFDLGQFMRRLPGLANSEEARRQIIDQMKIINEMNKLREGTLHDTIDKHGGIRNIDFDEAQRITSKKIKPQMTLFKKQFANLDKKIDDSYNKEITDFKKKIPKDTVAVRFTDGRLAYLPKANLNEFLEDKAGEAL